MGRRATEGPTQAELEILNILWKCGPSTVRRVQEELNELRPTRYTTALKMLQIMTEKGLVVRDVSEKSHVYESSRPQRQTQRQLLDDMARRLFNGSHAELIRQAYLAAGGRESDLPEVDRVLENVERQRAAL